MKEVIQKQRLALIASHGNTARSHAPAWECEPNTPVLRTQRWSVAGCVPTETVGTRSLMVGMKLLMVGMKLLTVGMRLFSFTLLAALTASLCLLGWFNTASAGAWSVVQETTIGTTNIEQTQSGSTANAVQAVNHINLASGDTLNFATQTVDGNSKPVTFIQEGSTSGSIQALNHASAESISSTILQNASTFGNVSFEQNDATSNNTQAMNSIKTTGNVTGVTQLVSISSPVSFSQNASGSGNVQAVNVIDANTGDSAITLGSTSQQAFLTGGVTFDGSNPTLQAVNALLIPAGTGISSSNQATLATSVNISGVVSGFTSTSATSSTPPQALNFIGARP